ncbi:hypothetical protein [Klebsiella electrica]|uniref:hypothetical protein n=1 Tax=Klebsiella electrica TaxID=1259973 RepID=UPI0011632623|nr:hypothetical protein [Klebsiella electrica]QDI06791.1 hypothetical protein electrica_00559 [Klebsiella electrica]WIO42703.1 hypothetical protein P2G42_23135 [Klebsiella electrica]
MFNEYTDLKSALGLSSRSITHRWNETGVSDIEGYATHIEKLAKYVKWMETAGKIGIGLSALDTAAKITEACTVGRDCAKISFTSIGEFAGSLAGGLWQAELSKAAQQVQSAQWYWGLQQ